MKRRIHSQHLHPTTNNNSHLQLLVAVVVVDGFHPEPAKIINNLILILHLQELIKLLLHLVFHYLEEIKQLKIQVAAVVVLVEEDCLPARIN